MKTRLLPLFILATSLLALPARAVTDLNEYALNQFGIFSSTGGEAGPVLPLPGQPAFDFTTGLGSLSFLLDRPGSHYLGVFLDLSIDERANTFFNEFGTARGLTKPGQTWEIDEPGYLFGDIFMNIAAGTLDNQNSVPETSPDDVSLALGWDFLLGDHQQAEVQFLVSTIAPAQGFYLQQTDPHSQTSLYLSTSLLITDKPHDIPDPANSLSLLTAALALLVLFMKTLRYSERQS